MSITTAQIRGARGILDWSQADLSERTGISATSIGSIENGQSTPRASTLDAIRKAFESAGVEFIGLDGVRTKSADIKIWRGTEGYLQYSMDVFETLQRDDREVLQAYVDDSKYADKLEKEAYPHVERMESLQAKKFKILQKEGDIYFPAKEYAEYRWIPKEQFLPVPFIVYGDKFAIQLFEPEPTIIVNSYPMVADAYRIQFEALWENSIIP
ncbi:MAG: helix-turn-helix transcriptional regulator, partial [Pseudomonadota bacterium]